MRIIRSKQFKSDAKIQGFSVIKPIQTKIARSTIDLENIPDFKSLKAKTSQNLQNCKPKALLFINTLI